MLLRREGPSYTYFMANYSYKNNSGKSNKRGSRGTGASERGTANRRSTTRRSTTRRSSSQRRNRARRGNSGSGSRNGYSGSSHRRSGKRQNSRLVGSKNRRIAMRVLMFVLVVFFFAYGSFLIRMQAEKKRATETLEQREELVYDVLIDAGYSVAGACGIMGNIAVESPDFDPTEMGSNGAYGIFQWTETGERRTKMWNWCDENGYDSASIEGQLAFAIYELEGGDPIACRVNDYLKGTDDAYTAAVEFAAGFERCVSNSTAGGTYTGSLYPEYYGTGFQGLNRRINAAVNYYEKLK